jgi:MHS family shikimate/dehydroshikimate transporter-like MFS transporter
MDLKSKVTLSSALGATFAWYDFTIFNIAIALIFPQLFFPDMGFLIPILIFAVGFLARPLGGIIYGSLGDRFGRKKTLVATLYLTGITTTLIGLLPTHADIGIAATMLLILARILQTVAFGGEWAAASTMIVEYHAQDNNKGLLAGLVSSGWAVANIMAALVFLIVTSFGDAFFLEWGWRIPFLLSVVLLIIGVYIRMRVIETPAFAQAQQTQQLETQPVREVFRNYLQPLVAGAVAIQLAASWMYVILIFGFGYFLQHSLATRAELTQVQFVMSWVLLMALIFFGWLGDRIGRHRLFVFGALCSLALMWPVIAWIEQGQVWLALTAMIVLACPAFVSAPALFAEMFPTKVRQTGSGISYNLGLVLAGFSPLAAQQITLITGDITNLVWLFAATSLLSLAASMRLKQYVI